MAGMEPLPRTDEATARMRQGPDHRRASQRWWEARQEERDAREQRRSPAPPRTELPERAVQRSGAGTRRLDEETDWWGGDDNVLHYVMRAYQAARRFPA